MQKDIAAEADLSEICAWRMHESLISQYKDMSALAKISDTDTEMIAKLSASHLIRQAEPNSLSLSNLTPAHLNLSRHLQEYLISWAYEEE